MVSLLRRRAMMVQAASPTPSEWDVEWDYTMGVPDDNGFTLVKVGNTSYSSETVEDDGISVKVRSTSVGISWVYPNTSSIGVIEAKFRFTSGQLGFRTAYGDGERAIGIRAQYSTNYKGIYYEDSTSLVTKLAAVSINTDYTVRIVRNGNTGDIYVDGVLAAQNVGLIPTSLNRTETRCQFYGANNSNAYGKLYSIKLKLGRI